MFKNQKGIAQPLLLIAAVGLTAFLMVSNVFDFRDRLFGNLFPKPSSKAESNYIQGEILIQFKAGISEEAKTNARGKVKAIKKQVLKKEEQITTKSNKEELENIPPNPTRGDLEVDSIPTDQVIADIITRLQQDPNVVFAQPNTNKQ